MISSELKRIESFSYILKQNLCNSRDQHMNNNM